MDADLRLLRYFVAVAEELNFTRAAGRLHMTQQPLSAAIRRLEADLGVELFARTTRRVELTEAGRALLAPARAAIEAAGDALAAARAAGHAVAGELDVGLSSGAHYGLEPLFLAVAEAYPDMHLRTRQDSAGPLLAQLREGRLDLAITFAARIPAELGHLRLKDEPVVVAVAATHSLAERGAVSLTDLQEETFALDAPEANPDYDEAVIDACRRGGFEPSTRASSALHESWEWAVHNEGCVGLTVHSAFHAAHRELRLLALEEPLTLPLDLVWRQPQRPLAGPLEAVIATAREVRAEQGWGA